MPLVIKPDEILDFIHITFHHFHTLGSIGLYGKPGFVVDGHPTSGQLLVSEGAQDIFSLLDGQFKGILLVFDLHIPETRFFVFPLEFVGLFGEVGRHGP